MCLAAARRPHPRRRPPSHLTPRRYGHIRALAEEIKKGLESSGCDVTFLRVPETLSDEILGKMHAPPKADDVEATADMLTEYDGIMFGLPTRFGMAAGQMKAFMDSTGGLWQKGALVGKPAGVFFSTATQNGGQETTGFTFLTQLTHHGMIFVSLPARPPLLPVHACVPPASTPAAAARLPFRLTQPRPAPTDLPPPPRSPAAPIGTTRLLHHRPLQQRRGSRRLPLRVRHAGRPRRLPHAVRPREEDRHPPRLPLRRHRRQADQVGDRCSPARGAGPATRAWRT